MIRAFVAIELPSAVVRHLEEVSGGLRKLGLHGSLTAPTSIHLTLKFLGNIEESQVEPISERIEECCRTSAFELEAGGLGAFPHLGRPRVVWVGLKTSPALSDLHRCIESGLAREGFEPENRPFHPHLTLLRLKSQRNVPELARFISRAPRQTLPFSVEAVHLYRSILHPQGAQHLKLFTAPLRMEEEAVS